MDHIALIFEKLNRIETLLTRLVEDQTNPPHRIDVVGEPEIGIPDEAPGLACLRTPSQVAEEFGWTEVKVRALAAQKGLTVEPYASKFFRVAGIGKPPREDFALRETGYQELKKLYEEDRSRKAIHLTGLETDVLIKAEELGIDQGPVLLSGWDLVDEGFAHGAGATDRCILDLINRGLLRQLDKPDPQKRGKLVERTEAILIKYPGSYLMKERRKRIHAPR